MKSISIIFLFQCLFFANFANAADPEKSSNSKPGDPLYSDNCLWLEFGKQAKEKDGSVIQNLRIKTGSKSTAPPFSEFKNLHTIYRVNRKGQYYSAPIHYDGNGAQIKITAMKSSFFEVSVSANIAKENYFAETSFHLFAHSNKMANRIPAKNVPGNFPMVRIVSPKYNYWPQTGEKFTFAIDSGIADGCDFAVKVFERTESNLNLNDKLEFTYTPPHDKHLDMQGTSAYKGDVICLKKKSDNGICKITYTLLLHRSRFAHHNFKYGIALLLGTGIILTGAIVLKRRYCPVGGRV